MSINTYLNKEVNIVPWENLLKKSQYASPFQTQEYYSFLNQIDGMRADVFAIGNNKSYEALCVVTLQKEKGLKTYFSRRAIIYGGFLLSLNVSKQTIDLLIRNITKYYKRQAIYIEIRNYFDYSYYKETFKLNSWQYEPYLNFQLNLKDIYKDKVLTLFSYNRRREIKLSISEGVTYNLCENIKDLEILYRILEELYKKRVKLPIPELSYFIGLYESKVAKIFIVKHQGRVIGGSICLLLRDKAIYTYYYCGIRNYNKKIFPTHMAVLAAIEYAIDNKIFLLDFMGAGKPNSRYGVREYKAQFGGNLVEHGRFIKVLNPTLLQFGKLGLKIMSILK